jgi:AraC-like DNA-binding protein
MLTAKADIASKIEGLESGADAYLAKPFNKQELLVRLRKLMELRHKLRQHYLSLAGISEAALSSPAEAGMQKNEDAFVQKVREMVVMHLNDNHFDVRQLCRHVGMSHSQLHRKLTALTGYSTNRFIRCIRLSKAKKLLAQTEETVSSVAYDLGFSAPDYFTRIFTKEFGMSPTEFRRSQIDSY